MKKNLLNAVLLMLLLGLGITACQPKGTVAVPNNNDESNHQEIEFTYGEEAVILSLEVLLIETLPADAQAIVTGYLPDGCVEMVDITVSREDQSFNITFNTRRMNGDIACTEVLVIFEEVIDLDIEGLAAGTYTVIAQDQRTTFSLPVDNVSPQENEGDYMFGSDAVVEAMSLDIMKSFPAEVSVTLEGYLPDGCTQLDDILVSRDEQTFTIDIITKRPAGDVACIMVLRPFTKSIFLDVEGLPAGEYLVRHGDFVERFTFVVDNVDS